jgi:hypothetical protein
MNIKDIPILLQRFFPGVSIRLLKVKKAVSSDKGS